MILIILQYMCMLRCNKCQGSVDENVCICMWCCGEVVCHCNGQERVGGNSKHLDENIIFRFQIEKFVDDAETNNAVRFINSR